MKQHVVFTRGISASGKSTYAKSLAEDHGYARCNMDDIRTTLGLPFTQKNEQLALAIQDQIVLRALRSGRDVVVDNLHLHVKWPRRLAVLIWESGIRVEYEIKDFTHVPLDLCIERNNMRDTQITTDIIKRQFDQLNGQISKGLWTVDDLTAGLPDIVRFRPDDHAEMAVIVDIDGTLADNSHRSPYDFDELGDDALHEGVAALVDMYGSSGYKVVVMSGRDSQYRDRTIEWLNHNGVQFDDLFMRAEGDQRRDSVVKLELFNTHVRDKYNVEVAIDDRLRVCQMWRNLGIPVLRVGDPEADF